MYPPEYDENEYPGADVAKDFTAARVNAEGSAKAAMNAAKRREGRVRNFQDWLDKHEEYQKAGGYKAWKNKQEQLEQKKKELAVAMDAVADQVDEINNRLKDKKEQLAAAATAVAEGTDKKTKVTAKVEAAKKAVEKAGEKVTSAKATLDDLTVQRAELEASVMSYPEGAARDRVLEKIVDIDSQISAANREVQNATNEQTTKETEYTTAQSELATAESELTALTSQHSTLESELQDIERELETVTSCGGLAEQVEQLTGEVELITNLRNTSAKANLVIQGIKNNISGSGSAAAEAEARVLKILSAADSDALEGFKEIGKKHDKQMEVIVDDSADKVYGVGTPAAELVKALSVVPNSDPPISRKKDEYSAIESALSRAISNEEFADVIRSYGGTVPATDDEITQLRSAVQSKMSEFQTKHEKDEFATFYDEVLEYQRTGKSDGVFGPVIKECLDAFGKPNPEFQSAITAIQDRADTYSQVSPQLSGASGNVIKDFHDDQEKLVGRLRAGSQGVHTTEIKDEIYGNNEKKS